mgnify:CR=1 FL=1
MKYFGLGLWLLVNLAWAETKECPAPDALNHYVTRADGGYAGPVKIYYRLLKAYNPKLPTLLIINGGPGGNHQIINHFEEYSKFANIVGFDHRGLSCTSFLGVPHLEHYAAHMYSMEKAAQDIEAIRKDLIGDEKWFVYGLSYGTMLGQQYVTDFSKSVRGIILDSAFHDGSFALPIARDQYFPLFIESNPETNALYQQVIALYPDAKEHIPSKIWQGTYNYYGRTVKIPNFLRQILSAKTKEEAAKIYTFETFPTVGMQREILCEEIWDFPTSPGVIFPMLFTDCATIAKFRKPMNFTEALKKLKVPMMIWGGAFDPATPIQAMREIQRLTPDSFLFENKYAGHGIAMEKPQCALALADAFLKSETKAKFEAIAKSDDCQSPPASKTDQAQTFEDFVGVKNSFL